jgi:CTP:molybdopterin cytidylyltransferase MocA
VDGAAGLLLAAGAGRRYGMPKALIQSGGELLVARGLRVLREGGLSTVVVVLGAAAEQVRTAADLTGAHLVVNEQWATGMGSSLRAGLAALAGIDVEAALVMLVDLPGITPQAISRVASLASTESLVAASYRGEQGHPVLIGRSHWIGVAELATGDRGARAYLTAHAPDLRLVPCDDVADGTDMDVPIGR